MRGRRRAVGAAPRRIGEPLTTAQGETPVSHFSWDGRPVLVTGATGLLGSWDVSILPVMTYEGGRVKEMRIYPIDVRRSAGAKQSGLPRIASPELGRRILALLRELSTPFGTDIRIEGNVGVIRPTP